MSTGKRPPLRGRIVSPLRVEHTSPEGWQKFGGAEVRNGLPEAAPYAGHQAGEAARDAEIAAEVAAAQARADALPGAIPRCGQCRRPAAECLCDLTSE